MIFIIMEQKYIKLSKYAKNNGIHYRTAWNYYNDNLIPGAFKTEKGTILVPVTLQSQQSNIKKVALYARVSSNDRKNSLDNQLQRLIDFSISNGYQIITSIKEIASGMNDNRPKLSKLLESNEWDTLIVENKDRLTRFGFNYIETLLKNQSKNIIVVNLTDNDKHDLMQDLISIIYSFSARLYGQRKAKNKAQITHFLNN